jgi:hypothetical protein
LFNVNSNIHMKVGRNIHIDGVLSANGSEASSGNAGGGSGGSVFIESYNISGHGIISTYGG